MSCSTSRTSSRRRVASAAGAALALASALAACAPVDATPWRTLAPAGAGFSVAMPGDPTHDRRYGKNDVATLETNVYTLVLDEGGVYTVAESRLPPSVDSKSGTPALVESACDRLVSSASARLVSKHTVFLGGREGRQLEADVPESAVAGGGTMLGRVFVSGDHLYEVVAVVPRPAASSSSVERFLGSFQLSEP
jgi:hypothetical protein